jgi:hypothetical protein
MLLSRRCQRLLSAGKGAPRACGSEDAGATSTQGQCSAAFACKKTQVAQELDPLSEMSLVLNRRNKAKTIAAGVEERIKTAVTALDDIRFLRVRLVLGLFVCCSSAHSVALSHWSSSGKWWRMPKLWRGSCQTDPGLPGPLTI